MSELIFNHDAKDLFDACSVSREDVIKFSDEIKSKVSNGTRRSVATEVIEKEIKNNRVFLRISVMLTVSFLEKNLLRNLMPGDDYDFKELTQDCGEYNHKSNNYSECCGVTMEDMQYFVGNVVAFAAESFVSRYEISYSKLVEYVENQCLENNKVIRLTSMITTDSLFKYEKYEKEALQ